MTVCLEPLDMKRIHTAGEEQVLTWALSVFHFHILSLLFSLIPSFSGVKENNVIMVTDNYQSQTPSSPKAVIISDLV